MNDSYTHRHTGPTGDGGNVFYSTGILTLTITLNLILTLKLPRKGKGKGASLDIAPLRSHHRRSAQVWHVFLRDFTVLPANPALYHTATSAPVWDPGL